MPQGVGRDAFLSQRLAAAASSGQMLVQNVLQAVMTQGLTSRAGKNRIGLLTLSLSQPTTQNADRLIAKRSTSCLASFAQALYVSANAEDDVLAAQANEL